MEMSYLKSLKPQLFKNIAYVGSFKHFSVQLFFCNSTKTSANSSAMDLVLYCKTMYRVASVGIEESTDCTISQSLNPA